MCERQALETYPNPCAKADEEAETMIDPTAVQAALDKFKRHPKPEAQMLRTAGSFAPSCNVQTAVDADMR